MFSRQSPTIVGVSPSPDPFLLAASPHTWGIHGLWVPRFSRKVVYLSSKRLLAYFFLSPLNLLHISQGKKALSDLNTKITVVSGLIL